MADDSDMRQRVAAHFKGRPLSFWVVALAVLASIASLFVVAETRARARAAMHAAHAAQRERLSDAAARINGYLADASALARQTAASVGQVRGDRVLATRILTGLMSARRNDSILGLGFYFPPGVFDSSGAEFAPYVHVGSLSKLVAATGSAGPRPDWVAYAQRTPNRVTFLGPYKPMHKPGTSALLAVYSRGRFIGMASADTLPSTLVAILRRGLRPEDVAYVTDPTGSAFLRTGSIPSGDGYGALEEPLERSRVTLHFVTDFSQARAAARYLKMVGAAVILGIWIGAALIAFVVIRMQHARSKTRELELEQQRLQGEIATRIEVEKRLREAAYIDVLTELPNRGFFLERLSLVLSLPGAAHEYAVLHVDLDRFNLVNDTHGHTMGDELLRRIGARMLDALPEEAVLARLGGDEFIVLVHGGSRAAMHYAAHLVELLRLPLILRDRDVYLTASIGVVLLDGTYREPQDVLRDADIAMYEAKARGRNGYTTFDTFMRRRVERELQLGHDLRRAIEQNAFVAHYQPIVELATGGVASYEALARWERDGDVVGAGAFIPHAEQQGLVGEIDERVFARVCADLENVFDPSVRVAINISAAHLTEPHLVPRIIASLQRHDIDPGRIKLEVTETAIMSNAERSLHTLQRLRDLGIEIVVDDFGAGHSSLAYLQRLPIAGVKIDRSFISTIETDRQAVEIVRSIVALTSALRLYTVAEGIENASQVRILRDLGVRFGQGFFFSRPATALHAAGRSHESLGETAS